jgi:anti-sigma regulatory factor (Ser/Thr protein kinase)
MTDVSVLLAPDTQAPFRARVVLAQVLADRAGSEGLALAQLALSEIITNAIRHGGVGVSASIQLVVERTDPLVTVSVTQPGPVPDRPSIVNMPDPWSTSGYGLGIVDAVADRWGVRLDPPSVWFEITL